MIARTPLYPPSPLRRLPDDGTCTKAPIAPAGYKFTQGMNHAGDNILNCSVLGEDNFTSGWPDLADLCSNTTGCVAVNMYVDTVTSNYMYCLKTSGTYLVDASDLMPDACLGILVKVLAGEWLGGHGS